MTLSQQERDNLQYPVYASEYDWSSAPSVFKCDACEDTYMDSELAFETWQAGMKTVRICKYCPSGDGGVA